MHALSLSYMQILDFCWCYGFVHYAPIVSASLVDFFLLTSPRLCLVLLRSSLVYLHSRVESRGVSFSLPARRSSVLPLQCSPAWPRITVRVHYREFTRSVSSRLLLICDAPGRRCRRWKLIDRPRDRRAMWRRESTCFPVGRPAEDSSRKEILQFWLIAGEKKLVYRRTFFI